MQKLQPTRRLSVDSRATLSLHMEVLGPLRFSPDLDGRYMDLSDYSLHLLMEFVMY